MVRLTKSAPNGAAYQVDLGSVTYNSGGYTGKAVDRLAKLENAYEELIATQQEVSHKMELLLCEGKAHTPQFRDLLRKKVLNNNMIHLFEGFGF